MREDTDRKASSMPLSLSPVKERGYKCAQLFSAVTEFPLTHFVGDSLNRAISLYREVT